MVCSAGRFVVCLSVCHFVLVLFGPFGIAITSLGDERVGLGAFRAFVRFVLVWICWFPRPLEVWEGLRFVIDSVYPFPISLSKHEQNLRRYLDIYV